MRKLFITISKTILFFVGWAVLVGCLLYTSRCVSETVHVHDEIVLEVENGVSSVEKVVEIMCKENRYLKGLKLRADGFESNYYKK